MREQVLDSGKFDLGFKKYIQRWAFKHPQPTDFFRTISDYSGENLDWFWREWFYSTDVLDQALDSVVTDSVKSRVYISNKSGMMMPFKLQVSFVDGKVDSFNVPVEAWYLGSKYALTVNDSRKIQKVVIDPDHVLPDIDRNNNVWENKDSAPVK